MVKVSRQLVRCLKRLEEMESRVAEARQAAHESAAAGQYHAADGWQRLAEQHAATCERIRNNVWLLSQQQP